jgi:GntR family transcriptional repressor for pyruvate dehydrogenase complex
LKKSAVEKPMNFQPIHRTTTPEMIVQEILRRVKAGELKPGDKLPPERDLTKMFGVGRSSVREAIVALVLTGYLEVIQGKGTFLKNAHPSAALPNSKLQDVLAAENILDLMELREILECNMAKLAAERANSRRIRLMKKAVAKMKNHKNDIKRFYRADFDFHIALAEAADNRVTNEIMRVIVEKAHEHYMQFMPDTLCEPDKAIRTAEEIVEYLEKGDARGAANRMRSHLNLVRAELKCMVPEVKKSKRRGTGKWTAF